jgi:lipopolysaccharide transport system ATP-binding protein
MLSETEKIHKINSLERIISLKNVSKMFPLYDSPRDRLKQSLINSFPFFFRKKEKLYNEFWALNNISFEQKKGECIGIIGQNGSGKSTLLQILAGTLSQTGGTVKINGRISAMLELGSGFNPNFTGKENIYINGALLGFKKKEIKQRFDEIISFADIGDFIDQPVKFYSSGMFVRLAFAVQACLDPDILIIDEVLSVGDIFFQQKCHERMEELISKDTAIIIVSHNMEAIEKYSTKTLLLDKGKNIFFGNPNEAVQRYFSIRDQFQEHNLRPDKNYYLSPDNLSTSSIPDWPDKIKLNNSSCQAIIGDQGIAKFNGTALYNQKGEPCNSFEVGETAIFFYEFELCNDIFMPIGGIRIINNMNINIHGKNSLHYQLEAPKQVCKGAVLRFRQSMQFSIAAGEYTFLIGLATLNTDKIKAEDKFNFETLSQQLKFILRIGQAGEFIVKPAVKGPDIPFYDQVDLPGDIKMSII